MPVKARPVAERFWSKVDKTSGCWIWVAALDQYGYGAVRGDDGKTRKAHRVAYELSIGPIPDGLTLDHLCRERRCCRPDHLDPVSRGENVLRGSGFAAENAAKTHCVRGHPFDDLNTRIRPDGRRACRVCSGRRL